MRGENEDENEVERRMRRRRRKRRGQKRRGTFLDLLSQMTSFFPSTLLGILSSVSLLISLVP